MKTLLVKLEDVHELTEYDVSGPNLFEPGDVRAWTWTHLSSWVQITLTYEGALDIRSQPLPGV
jgi:hypothetical protein